MESKQEEKEEGRKVPNLLCTVARMSVCESNSSILSKMAWIQHKQPFVAACLTHEHQRGPQVKPHVSSGQSKELLVEAIVAAIERYHAVYKAHHCSRQAGGRTVFHFPSSQTVSCDTLPLESTCLRTSRAPSRDSF